MEMTNKRWTVAPCWVLLIVLAALVLTACGSPAGNPRDMIVGSWDFNGHVVKMTQDGYLFMDAEPLGRYELTDSAYIMTVGTDIISFPYTLNETTFTFTKPDGTTTTYTKINEDSTLTDSERKKVLSLNLD